MTVSPTDQVVLASACLNCAAPLTGPFCAACGQRDIPPYPSVKDLVVDAFWELSGWDGRFASTVKALVQRPGMLTREFLEGRRARYISPLRLYLMASLVYFVLAASAPSVTLARETLFSANDGSRNAAITISRPERIANEARTAIKNQQALTPEVRDKALKDIERAPALLRPTLRKAVTNPVGFKRGLIEAMPRMLFLLLPVFAAIVALFYRGRNYPEHLYFAIHFHAFIFLALGARELLEYTRIQVLAEIVGIIALIVIPIYATMAFKRVYGGSMGMTLAKELAIGTLYCTASAIALLVTIYIVSL